MGEVHSGVGVAKPYHMYNWRFGGISRTGDTMENKDRSVAVLSSDPYKCPEAQS